MKVLINPSYEMQGGGRSSSTSFDSPSFLAAMEKLFYCGPNERIKQLEIDSEGIVARFEKRASK